MDDKAVECVRLGQRMRAAQSAFFRANSREDRTKALALSKRLEKEFDQMARYVLTLAENPSSPSP